MFLKADKVGREERCLSNQGCRPSSRQCRQERVILGDCQQPYRKSQSNAGQLLFFLLGRVNSLTGSLSQMQVHYHFHSFYPESNPILIRPLKSTLTTLKYKVGIF